MAFPDGVCKNTSQQLTKRNPYFNLIDKHLERLVFELHLWLSEAKLSRTDKQETNQRMNGVLGTFSTPEPKTCRNIAMIRVFLPAPDGP